MLNNIQVSGNKDTRSGFGDGILEAARKNPNIVALTADLAGSLKLNGFMKEFPDRFIQCGIAEANMMGQGAVQMVTQTINDLFFVVSVRGVQIPASSLLKGGLAGLFASLLAAAPPAWEAADEREYQR